MPNDNEKVYFSSNVSLRERASFEIGIKLGALYHILCGIPISTNTKVVDSIENGIEAAISCQPYVKSVKINIDREKIKGDKSTEFEYDEITGKVINATVVLEYKSVEITAKVEWVEDLRYPLMFIEKITTKN
ncbi:hypothetical protein ES705_12153 [subsurface metagenome]|jgi:hypothetical protein|uniref:Dihydroneopterin aldolase MtpD C-terminal domain-containing protein n=1 Tax=marine sediment metagenome TaxID=412755 RepID=X1ENK9_9ZZZZ